MKLPKNNVLNADKKSDYTAFVKQVTEHLLDTSYINYAQSTMLLNQELHPALQNRLRQQGVLPESDAAYKANLMDYQKSRRVVAVKFNAIDLKDLTKDGMLPVDVQGDVAMHSADEAATQPFHFLFVVGMRPGPTPSDPPMPVVVDMQDLPPAVQAQQAAPQDAGGPTP